MARLMTRILLSTLLVAAALPVAAQSSTTGSVRGTVTDPDGGVLPGVTVAARSEALVAGQLVAVTGDQGVFRFPSLPPGLYAFEATLDGFRPVRREGVKVDVGVALDLDLRMELGAMTDEIIVIGDAVQVSTVSNTVSFNLTSEFIEGLPLPRDVGALMNYTPGVNQGRAYGAPNNQGSAYNLDGVDVSDPASGQQWISPSPEWVDELQVTGLGSDAEYGGFTGGLVNVVTKSGGNEMSGSVAAYYSAESLNGENAPEGVETAETLDTDLDVVGTVGGKLIQDRLWYFLSAQERQRDLDPFYNEGAPADEIVQYQREWHRYLGKLTSQVSDSTRLVGLFAVDNIETANRNAGEFVLGSGAYTQDSPNWSYNLTWEKLVNDANFVSVKVTGFDGTNDSLPAAGRDVPGHDDFFNSGFLWANYTWTWLEDKQRMNLDASWSLFADGLLAADDSHTFKFGVVYEDSTQDEVRTRNGGFTYVDDSYYCDSLADYFADPFCGVFSSDRGNEIDFHAEQEGWHLYAQDSWKMRRVTVNLGVRYTSYTGGFKSGNSSVYDVDMIAPRAGLVWDVTGDGRNALKLHYGRYYDGLMAFMYDREVSGDVFTPLEFWDYNFDTGEFDIPAGSRPTGGALMDPDISHPYVDQYVLTFEHQVSNTMKLGVDYVHRENSDIIAMVNVNDDYDALIAPDNPLTGGGLPFFELLSPQEFVLTNPADATREYDAVIARFDRRFTDGWSFGASVVWSDLTGNTVDVDGYEDAWEDANGLVNNDGKLPGHSEWEVKLNARVLLPWDVTLSAYYTYLSGSYWTPYAQIRGLLENDRTNVNMLPLGSEQLDDRNLVDLHLEKVFPLGGSFELGLVIDAFNVFNDDAVTAVQQRWGTYRYQWDAHPEESYWQSSSAFGQPTDVVDPREVRVGVRFAF